MQLRITKMKMRGYTDFGYTLRRVFKTFSSAFISHTGTFREVRLV